jgi:hypothetical protein
MKSLLRITGVACMAILLFTACKKNVPKQVKLIPKDASFVIGINAQSLQEKLAKSNISLDSLMKTLFSSSSATESLKNWDELKNAGIDWTATPFAFVQTKNAIMSGQSTLMGAVAVLKDASKFEEYLKKKYPGMAIKKNSNYNTAVLQDGPTAGWNNDVVVLVYNYTPRNNFADSATTDTSAAANNSEQQLATLFALKTDESIASVDAFRDLIGEKADALFWQNSSGSVAAIPFVGMTKAADLLKDAYNAGTVNFEDGKAVATFKMFTSKALSDILKKYAGPTVDLSMVEKYPSSAIAGFASFAFNPKILVDVLQYSGLDAMVNQFLTKVGFNFTLADIASAFKGDFAIICSDISQQETAPDADMPSFKTRHTSARFLFNARVGDKAAYDKISTQLVAKGILLQQGDQLVLAEGGSMGTARINDKNVLLATDSLLLQQYSAGTGKADIPGDIKSKVKGKNFGMYIDIARLIQAFPSHDSALTDMGLHTFKDFVATTDNFDGQNIKGNMELRTVNEKENSLASILKFAAAAQKTRTQPSGVDSLMIDPSVK